MDGWAFFPTALPTEHAPALLRSSGSGDQGGSPATSGVHRRQAHRVLPYRPLGTFSGFEPGNCFGHQIFLLARKAVGKGSSPGKKAAQLSWGKQEVLELSGAVMMHFTAIWWPVVSGLWFCLFSCSEKSFLFIMSGISSASSEAPSSGMPMGGKIHLVSPFSGGQNSEIKWGKQA